LLLMDISIVARKYGSEMSIKAWSIQTSIYLGREFMKLFSPSLMRRYKWQMPALAIIEFAGVDCTPHTKRDTLDSH
jgi:hypothetical protein